MSKPLILVIGATGNVGSELVPQLLAAGQRVRVLTRDPVRAEKFGTAVEVTRGDLGDPASLTAAFQDVDKAFVLATGPDTAREANAFVAAEAAGVSHVVMISAQSVAWPLFAMVPFGQWLSSAEVALKATRLTWTILRPSYFMCNILWALDRSEDAVFLPAGEGAETPIDPFDIAAAAVKVLTTSGHVGKTYELTGPELLNHGQIMAKASVAAGRRLRYVDLSAEDARKRFLIRGFPEPFANSVVERNAEVKAGASTLNPTLEFLLGRPGRTFDDWLTRHASALR